MTDVLILTADEPLLAAPTSLIQADHLALDRLRRDLGGRAWQLAEGGPELVLHEHLLERGLEPAIRAVLTGASQRLRLPSKAQLKLAAQGGDLAACFKLSVCAERAGDLAGAIAWLERGGPGAYASLRLGRLYEQAGDPRQAFVWLERAVARDELALPDYLEARRELERLGAKGVQP